MENTKVCVEVTAKFDTDGTMTPVSFVHPQNAKGKGQLSCRSYYKSS